MLLTPLFILLLFDTSRCQMTSWVARREKMILALAYVVIVCLIRRGHSVICNLKLFRSNCEWKSDLFLHYSHSPAAKGERTEENCDWAFVRPSTQASTVAVVFRSMTPIFKAPSVNLSNFIYVVRKVHISGLLRWQLRQPYLKPQVSVHPTLSMWFATYI